MNNTAAIAKRFRQSNNLPDDLPLRVLTNIPNHPPTSGNIYYLKDGDPKLFASDWRLWSETEMFIAFTQERDREAFDALVMLLSDPDRSAFSAEALADCAYFNQLGSTDAQRVQQALARLTGTQKRDPEVARLGGLIDEIVERHS